MNIPLIIGISGQEGSRTDKTIRGCDQSYNLPSSIKSETLSHASRREKKNADKEELITTQSTKASSTTAHIQEIRQSLKPSRSERKKLTQQGRRLRDRLLSIRLDSYFVERCVAWLRDTSPAPSINTRECSKNSNGMSQRLAVNGEEIANGVVLWPVIPNQRCGSWYVPPRIQQELMPQPAAPQTHVLKSKQPYICFKSTDGHKGTYNFSTKRLNLPLISIVANYGRCILVDATKNLNKRMPDSFSRTLPIWCAVLNRMVFLLRQRYNNGYFDGKIEQKGQLDNDASSWWDCNLYTPSCTITQEEHALIASLIDGMAEEALRLDIFDTGWLLKELSRPLRPCWIVAPPLPPIMSKLLSCGNVLDQWFHKQTPPIFSHDYSWIVCISCSSGGLQRLPIDIFTTIKHSSKLTTKVEKESLDRTNTPNESDEKDGSNSLNEFVYTQGGADDHEAWSRGLTPYLFWSNMQNILGGLNGEKGFNKALLDSCTLEAAVDDIVRKHREANEEWYLEFRADEYCDKLANEELNDDDESKTINVTTSISLKKNASECHSCIGATNIFIGSRRAGRPPECWNSFDAILNVSTAEYPEFQNNSLGNLVHRVPKHKYYLQLPVNEGKKDRTELERFLPIGLYFIIHHLVRGRKVLVHCAQGIDRSVAVVICAVQLFCHLSDYGTNSSMGTNESIDDCIDDDDASRKEGHSSTTVKLCSWVNNLDFELLEQIILNDYTGEQDEHTLAVSNSGPSNVQNFGHSGIQAHIYRSLQGRRGRNLLFDWIRALSTTPDTTTKRSLRHCLSVLQRYRSVANPSRNTMQKINRFFLSNVHQG